VLAAQNLQQPAASYIAALLALLAQRWLLPTSTANAYIVGFIAYLLAVGSKMSTIHITGGTHYE